MNLPVVRTDLIDLEVFSVQCGLHPELVERFVALGLVEPVRRSNGELWFTMHQVRRVARMQRLRSDLALNYSALGLVLDLLERIEQLERASQNSVARQMEDR